MGTGDRGHGRGRTPAKQSFSCRARSGGLNLDDKDGQKLSESLSLRHGDGSPSEQGKLMNAGFCQLLWAAGTPLTSRGVGGGIFFHPLQGSGGVSSFLLHGLVLVHAQVQCNKLDGSVQSNLALRRSGTAFVPVGQLCWCQ